MCKKRLLLRNLSFPFFLFILLFNLQGKESQEETDKEIIQVEKEVWTVGVNKLQGSNLEDRHLYLLSSLPQLLQEELNSMTEHVLSEEEIHILKKDYLKEKILLSRLAVDDLHKKRDALLFSPKTEKEREEQYDLLSEQILKEIRMLQSWNEMDLDTMEIAQSLPIEYKENEASFPLSQVPHFLQKESLDMLITGDVERVEDTFFLELFCFEIKGEEPLYHWSGVGEEDELNSMIQGAAAEFRTILLGRSWSELVVTVEPSSSIVKLDGETIGVGSVTLETAVPGFRTLSVGKSGYISQTQQIYLPSMEQTELTISLEKGERNNLSLVSDPPGADVYFGAQWVGMTPVVLEEPEFPNDIKIALEGYKTFHVSSEELTGDNVTVVFDEAAYDKQTAFDEAKSRFYRSLGWASISMGVPLILHGIYQNQVDLYYKNGSQETYDRANRIYYYGFIGGVSLSGGLLINTLYRLRQYIKAAEESTEE